MSFLDPVLNPLLALNPLVVIILISVTLSGLITILYKYLTDQTLMKSLKDQLKRYQQEIKANKDNPSKMMEIQKKSMQVNMKYMMQSFKPMLFSFIPIILIFGWLNAHLAYEPIMPGQEFGTSLIFDKGITGNVTIIVPEELEIIGEAEQQIEPYVDEGWIWDSKGAIARWNLKSDVIGEYLMQYKYNDKTYDKKVIVTNKREYAAVSKDGSGKLETIKIYNKKMKPLNLFGFELGWIWTYIIFSILTNILLRKVLKIH